MRIPSRNHPALIVAALTLGLWTATYGQETPARPPEAALPAGQAALPSEPTVLPAEPPELSEQPSIRPAGTPLTPPAEPQSLFPPEMKAEPSHGQPGTVVFSGARSLTESQLRAALKEQISEIQERGLTRARADDTAYYLGVFYRKQGFPNTEVTWQIHGNQLQLGVREGTRTYLRSVDFVGNKSIDDATLQEYIVGVSRERLLRLKSPFVQTDLESGVARIRGLYESKGFLAMTVSEPSVRFTGNGAWAQVSVTIKEGPQSFFGTVHFEGEPLFERGELLKTLGERITGPYAPQQLATLQRDLQFFYKSRGYFQAGVSAESDPTRVSNGRIPVTFHITPGALFHFDGITVRGLERLRPGFLPKRFESLHGKTYDPAKLDEKYQDLLRTGIFKTLRIESVAQADKTIRLDITAEEAKAKELGFAVGASSYEGFSAEIRLADRNLFGRGRPLSLSVEASQRSLRGELLYVDPWFWDTEFHFRARLYAQDRQETGYSKRQTGLRGELERNLTRKFGVSAFTQFQNVEITDTTIEPQYLGPSSYQIATVGLTYGLNHRDDPVNPTRGWILNGTLDLNAVESQVAFSRTTMRFSYYKPLPWKLQLSLGARAGFLSEFTDVPIDERFFNGGATTVRSFQERELGPKDRHRNPIGGSAFTVFNAEVEFPIHGNFHGALFADAGNVVADLGDIASSDMRYALGVGLRYKLPIGPLRIDYGVNPNRKPGEDFGAFHFTFGFAF